MRLVVEDRAGMSTWRVNLKAPASLSQIPELKRLLIRLGPSVEVRWTYVSQTHFNIANKVRQVFFFVDTFVEMDRVYGLKAPANTCVR